MLDLNLIKVKVAEETDFFGRYEIEPLDRGYAQTIGNSLRRILLSGLSGAAVTSVKMHGVKHEYSTLAGIEEDIINIVLNLKQLQLRSFSSEPQTLHLKATKVGIVTAADFTVPSEVEILNPELVIATLADNKNPLDMEIIVENGVGYSIADGNRVDIGSIPIDANFSPVERVNFNVVSARLGQITDLDKLVIEIYTKSISPREAMKQSLELFENLVGSIKNQFNRIDEVVEFEEPVEEEVAEVKSTKK